MNTKKSVVLAILTAVTLVTATIQFDSVYAEKALSPAVLKECEKLYLKYRELGEEKFKSTYSQKAYLNDCIKLYKDASWTFTGKNKLDNYFDKIDAVKSKTKAGTSDIKSVKIIEKLKIGKDKYYVKFQACASDSGITNPTFLIQTDSEKFLAMSSKNLQSNKCLSYSTQVTSKYSNSIGLKFVNDGPLYQGLKIKSI